MLVVDVAQLYRVRAEGEASTSLHPKGAAAVPHLVAGDITRVRVRHLRSDNDQHPDAGDEGELL